MVTEEEIDKEDVWHLFRYYLGVLNKQTMTMEVHEAQLFNMQPVIPGKRPITYLLLFLTAHKDQKLWKECFVCLLRVTFSDFCHQERQQTVQNPRTLLRPTEKRCICCYCLSITRHLCLIMCNVNILLLPLMFPFQVDLLIEAFGTNKQKRALSSRRLNQVGSETLQQAVAKAANTVIGEKGLEGKLHSGCLS